MESGCKDCTIDFTVNPSPPRSKWGIYIAATFGGCALVTSAICIPFVVPALRKICLPYVPATTTQVENIFKALNQRKGSLIDLGSGDGRIVVAAAQKGFVATGVELNPWLVVYSKFSSLRAGYSSKTSFKRKDIWKTNLSSYDNVVIFGVECMMEELQVKIKAEMHKDAVVAACRFPFPNLKPNLTVGEGIDRVWLYSNKLSA